MMLWTMSRPWSQPPDPNQAIDGRTIEHPFAFELDRDELDEASIRTQQLESVIPQRRPAILVTETGEPRVSALPIGGCRSSSRAARS
jgi:hypothetical protein